MSEVPKRHEIISFIFESCTKLKLNSVSMATACVALHKVYKKCSESNYDLYTVATACILLSTKVEEEHTRLRDVINVCHRVLHPDRHLELNSEYWELKDSLASMELQILRMLQFQVLFDHPHKFLLHYLLSLSQLFNKKKWDKHAVSSVAWALLRDSYHGTLCLDYKPEIVALGCIALAISLCKLELTFRHEVPWWKALYNDCNKKILLEIQVEIAGCYEHEKAKG